MPRDGALRDPVTGLRDAEQFRVDVSMLDGEIPAGSRLLAMLDLEGVPAYERGHGGEQTDRLLALLAARLAAALGGSGHGYALQRGRFALIARPGRASGEALLRAATASLHDDRAGISAAATSVSMPLDAADPLTALRVLDHKRSVRRPLIPSTIPALIGAGAGALPGPHEAPPAERPPEGHEAIAAARDRGRRPSNPPPPYLPYLKVTTRFWITVLVGLAWMGISAWIAWPWIEDLAATISLPGAIALVAGIALIPGYLNVQLVSSLLMDKPAPIDFDFDYPGLTLLIAAYEEERNIARTLAYALDQDYPGELRVIVADDGSQDATASIARGIAQADGRVRTVDVPHGGKANALNAALEQARTPLIATIDADTLLMPNALRRIVARMLLAPDDVVAAAGSVLARNSRAGLLARAQSWDYFLGIGSIKRQQALLRSTLVAQGAFSVYDREALQQAGGWPDCIGEDIVMTWAMLDRGGLTSFEPTAVAFTEVPESLSHLVRQRRRWARGMIEGLRSYGVGLLRRRLPYAHSVAADMLFPYLDVAFTLAFIPGIVLACFGNFAIVGPMTLAVLPLNALLAGIMYRRQRRSLAQAGLSVRSHAFGFVAYLLLYQLIMSPVSVAGYLEETLHTGRRW